MNRLEIIKKLQLARKGRRLIVYITSTRNGMSVSMGEDCIRIIYDHLMEIKKRNKKPEIDLFIHSGGGSGIVPWRLVSLIREFTESFEVLIPYKAYSAATLVALGADKIIMHPMGELGPIDPSIVTPFNPDDQRFPGRKLSISVEDAYSYISFIKEDIGISHDDELIQAVKILAEKIHPLALGSIRRSQFQAEMLARKLLKRHMTDPEDEDKITRIIQTLTSKLYYHGHPINRKEAKIDLNLKVEEPNEEVEELMWNLYMEYEKEMKLNKNFNPIEEYNNKLLEIKSEIIKRLSETSKEIENINMIIRKLQREGKEIPKEILNKLNENQKIQRELHQQLNEMQVEINISGAFIESEYMCHKFVIKGKIALARPGQVILETTYQNWEQER